MTKKDMMNIINDVNTNKSIKWDIPKIGHGKITLTNSYDTGVKFVIDYSDEDFVIVRDMLQDVTVCSYLVGDTNFDDFETLKEAITAGIAKTVKFFNYYY